MRTPRRSALRSAHGMTLIELMIVVAIVGVLAAIGSVAYNKYLKQGKITKLRQYAMAVAQGQEAYRSRNNTYFNPAASYIKGNAEWEQLLEFNYDIEPGITVGTMAGNSTACPDNVCEGVGPVNAATTAWYAVRITQNLDGNDGTAPTTIIMHNEIDNAIVLNEGQ